MVCVVIGGGGALVFEVGYHPCKNSHNYGCFSGPVNVHVYIVYGCKNMQNWKQGGSRTMSHLLSRSHTFASIVILDLKKHQSMKIH